MLFKLRFSKRGRTVPIADIIGSAPSFESAALTGVAIFDKTMAAAGGNPDDYSLLSIERLGESVFTIDTKPFEDGGFDKGSINFE